MDKGKPLITAEDVDLDMFVNTLNVSSGYDLSNYSEKSLRRRVAKVLVDTKLDMAGLLLEIGHNRSFADRVVREITVNTTDLFRDPAVWKSLKNNILPQLCLRNNITIWHAGCSTGQEVYSLLVLLNELDLLGKVRVFGSDINSEVLDVAKKGVYKWRFNTHYLDNFRQVYLDEELTHAEIDALFFKYFTIDEKNDTIKVNDILLNKAEFVAHDLVTQPCHFYSSIFDLVLCRNVVIYFNATLQDNVFKLFSEKLDTSSFLLLGLHESILGSSANLFEKKDIGYIKR
jgi:chemotaxis protein methyltransferase CheR